MLQRSDFAYGHCPNVEDVLRIIFALRLTISTFGESSTAGTIFITHVSANMIYMLTKPYFSSNEVYTAANVANIVGLVDLNTRVVTPIVFGFEGVHGLAFSPTPVAETP